MKKTPSMYIKETDESRELYLYLINKGTIWPSIQQMIDGFRKHIKKGRYSHDKAMMYAYRIATYSAKMYCKEFASPNCTKYIFDVTCRWTVADELLCYIEEEYLKDEE